MRPWFAPLAVFLCLGTPLLATPSNSSAGPTWAWKAPAKRGAQLWLTSTRDGQDAFALRLGSAGTIAEIEYVRRNQPLLMGADWDPEGVDRAVQWIARPTKKYDPLAPYSYAYDPKAFNSEYIIYEPDSSYELNTTQAGCLPAQNPEPLAQTRKVVVTPARVDVYAKNDRMWTADVQQLFDGTATASLTRYELRADGVLKVRELVLMGDVFNRRAAYDATYGPLAYFDRAPGVQAVLAGATPAHDHSFMLYFENWLPFRATRAVTGPAPVFDTLSLAVNDDGTGDKAASYYFHDTVELAKNIPSYPAFHADLTAGYAVVHNRRFSSAGVEWPLVGVVYGRGPAQVDPGAGAIADPDNFAGDAGKSGLCLNTWFWPDNWTYDAHGRITGLDPLTEDIKDRGIAVLPALEMQKIVSGSVVDFTYYLVLRDGADATLKPMLDGLAASDAGVRVHAPGIASFPGADAELRAIVAQLQAILDDPANGPRTADIASLVESVPSPSLRQIAEAGAAGAQSN